MDTCLIGLFLGAAMRKEKSACQMIGRVKHSGAFVKGNMTFGLNDQINKQDDCS